MHKKFSKKLLAALLVSAVSVSIVGTTTAYLTDATNRIVNKYTIALDTTSKIVERFPEITQEQTKTPVIEYEKSVAVINSGYVDEYVRVKINVSDSSVRGDTMFSQDGTNFYKWDEFCNNVGDGWHYNSSDGYFYYDKIVKAGDWKTISTNGMIVGNDSDGHYIYTGDYDENNITDISSDIITTKLIRKIRTSFSNYQNMQSYDVYVFNESCPYYLGEGYANTWENYKKTNS